MVKKRTSSRSSSFLRRKKLGSAVTREKVPRIELQRKMQSRVVG